MSVAHRDVVPSGVEEIEAGLLSGGVPVRRDEQKLRLSAETEEFVVVQAGLEKFLRDDPPRDRAVGPFAEAAAVVEGEPLPEPLFRRPEVEGGLAGADDGAPAVVGAFEHEALRKGGGIDFLHAVPDGERRDYVLRAYFRGGPFLDRNLVDKGRVEGVAVVEFEPLYLFIECSWIE